MNEISRVLQQSKGLTVRVYLDSYSFAGAVHEVGIETVILKAKPSQTVTSDGFIQVSLTAIQAFEIVASEA